MKLPPCVFCAFEGKDVYGTDFYGVLLCNVHRGVVQKALELHKYLARDPQKMYCPNCGVEQPTYDFMLNAGRNLQMEVQYITIICGGEKGCRTILGISILELKAAVVPGVTL
jgi:hypothetical protein